MTVVVAAVVTLSCKGALGWLVVGLLSAFEMLLSGIWALGAARPPAALGTFY